MAKLEIELAPELMVHAKAMAAAEGKALETFIAERVVGIARGDDALASAVQRLRGLPAVPDMRLGLRAWATEDETL